MTKSHCLASKPYLEMSICSVRIGGDHWLSGYSRRLPIKWIYLTPMLDSEGSIIVRNDQFSPLSISFIIFCESHLGGGYGGEGEEGCHVLWFSPPQGNIHPL